MHLAIDGYVGDARPLGDPALVCRFLDGFPDAIGMTKISEPHVMTYHSPKPEDWGVSGFVIIAESHISVHTFPARQFVNIDIFSCREFDPQRALEQARAFFSLVSVHAWVLERGLEHYSPEEARQALAAERAGLAGAP